MQEAQEMDSHLGQEDRPEEEMVKNTPVFLPGKLMNRSTWWAAVERLQRVDVTEHAAACTTAQNLSPLKHHPFSNADGETIWTLCAGSGFVIEQES